MKKYRLRCDTVLYPKGTEVCWEAGWRSYVIRHGDGVKEWLYPWQVEGNSLWEEITEDQREEEVKVCPPHEYESLGTEDGEKECVFCGNTPLDSFKQEHIGGENKKPDHQALREESLEKYEWMSVENIDYSTSEIAVTIRVVMSNKYAEAWRDLLNDQKEG